MDDALKGKVFQDPQEGSNPSVPREPQAPPGNPPSIPSQPINSSAETSQPSQEKPPLQSYEPVSVSHDQSFQDNPSFQQPIPSDPSQAETVPSMHSMDTGSSGGSAPKFSTINIVKLIIGFFAVLAVVLIAVFLILPNFNKKVETVDLTFWDIPDSLNVSSVLPEFEKENPNIKINLVKQDIKDYRDKLTTRIKNGNGPDLFRFHNTWVLQLSDVLLPIPSNIIAKDQFNKTFYQVASNDLIKNGAVYGIPVEINTLSLFVNSAMLKQANIAVPVNWNDFVTASRTLTLKDQSGTIKVAGAAMGTFDNITHAPDIISMLFSQDNVPLDNISQEKDRVSDALKFYTGFAQGDGSVWDANQQSSIVAFSRGTLAMFFGYQKDLSSIKSANPSLSFDVFNVPYLTGQNKTIASYYPIGVSLKSRHQKEALVFLKFLTRKDVSLRLSSLPPARVDLQDKTNGEGKFALSSYFSGETFDNGLNSQMNAHLADSVNSILSGSDPVSAANNLVLGFSQVIDQFVPKQ